MTTAPARRPPRRSKPEPQGQRLKFLRAFLREPTRIGAVAPTSRAFARFMVGGADTANAKHVVEFGPGTGVVSDELLKVLPPTCRYMAIELDPVLCRIFRQRHPGVMIKQDSAANVETLCKAEGWGPVDIIMSGLPWASFPRTLQDSILGAAHRVLRPGGKFLTFGYRIGTILPAGRRFYKEIVPTYFTKVTRSKYIWRNLPPAFFLTCEKS
ncbi:MAG: class I SAM-dependent methyltransferase [Phycisphaerales bacterium]